MAEKENKKLKVCSPDLNSSQEEKDAFIKILDNHFPDDEAKKSIQSRN